MRGPAEFCEVEGVERLAQLVQHVVGDVGDVIDWTLTDSFETLCKPVG